MRALLRKRQIPDNKESKQRAIESDLFETSAPSEESDGLLKGLGLSDSSDDAIEIGEAPEPNYGGKNPKHHIKALIDKKSEIETGSGTSRNG